MNEERKEIKIKRIKSVKDSKYYNIESYRKALNDDCITELLKTNSLYCELASPNSRKSIRDFCTINIENACGIITDIDDDEITVVPLNNSNGRMMQKIYESNDKELTASMRYIGDHGHIKKIITFNLLVSKKGVLNDTRKNNFSE